MGTRNLTVVVSDGIPKVAQYGQWDGYPSGQGTTALKFASKYLKDKTRREKFKNRLQQVRLIDEKEHAEMWKSVGVNTDEGGWITAEDSDRFKQKFPTALFSRDFGAEILEEVAKAKQEVQLINSYDFAGDSLFCEWAYVIDLDKKTFEVYEGFNKQPLSTRQRFHTLRRRKGADGTFGPYYPVKLRKKWSLDDLPSLKEFHNVASKWEEAS